MIQPVNKPGIAKKAVLVVEDDVLIRFLVCDMLRERGAQVIEAASAEEALACLRSPNQVSVVFSDVRMPGMDGVELMRLIHRDYPAIKVILTSAHLPSVAALPATPLIQKPYVLAEVVAKISAALSRTDEKTGDAR